MELKKLRDNLLLQAIFPVIICAVFGTVGLCILDTFGFFVMIPELYHGLIGVGVGCIGLIIGFILQVMIWN